MQAEVEAEALTGDDDITNADDHYEDMSQQLEDDAILRQIPPQSRNGESVMDLLMSQCSRLGRILGLIDEHDWKWMASTSNHLQQGEGSGVAATEARTSSYSSRDISAGDGLQMYNV